MGLVNKPQEHYRAVKRYFEEQGLILVERLTDIPKQATIAEISEGVYDIDLSIARGLVPQRTTSSPTGLTVPNPDIQVMDCGADYLGINLTPDKSHIAKSQIIATKVPCMIQDIDIKRQTVYIIPDGIATEFNEYVGVLRKEVFVNL